MKSLSDAEKIDRYKIFDPELQMINDKFISSKIGDPCKQKFTKFLLEFKSKLYEIESFLENQKLVIAQGSSYEGLSVGKTCKEFDVIFHIHIDKNLLKSSDIQKAKYPGYITLKIVNEKNTHELPKVFKKWMDSENYLQPAEFARWARGIMQKTLNKYPKLSVDGNLFEINMSILRLAITLHVTERKSNIKFDIDFIFLLSFNKWHLENWNGQSWFAISNQLDSFGNDELRSWRYSFPVHESKLLDNCKHLKNTIRLVKQVLDNCKMTYVNSYYIKTLFMWEVGQRDSKFWNKSLGYTFVIMLYKLRDALTKKRINFYYDEELNLLGRLSSDEINHGLNKINKVIQDIEKLCNQNLRHEIEAILISSS